MTSPHPGYTRRWRVLKQSSPTVATDWTITAPGNLVLRVVSLVARLVTDANVANRQVSFSADDGTNTWWATLFSAAQAAGATVDYVIHTAATRDGTATVLLSAPIPSQGLLLHPGNRLVAATTNKQVGDQWSAIRALVDEIPTDTPMAGDFVTSDSDLP